jgi:hypothetical protein
VCGAYVVCCRSHLEELAVVDLAGAVLVHLLENLRELLDLFLRELREVGRRRLLLRSKGRRRRELEEINQLVVILVKPLEKGTECTV